MNTNVIHATNRIRKDIADLLVKADMKIPNAMKKVKYRIDIPKYNISFPHSSMEKGILYISINNIPSRIGIKTGTTRPIQDPKNFAPIKVARGMELENISFRVPSSRSPLIEL